ncbi:MAG: GIY-YIG nuclease family protein [Candidatus Magasanikbacteria bacterium]|nr:GIY-YIG nuclease family protein [Candidatus Magasanikbacteria bacterium]
MLYKRLPCLKEFYVYIMASKSGTLYVGSTENIISRVYEHKNGLLEGFTKRYNCSRLVYYEELESKQQALDRETQIKKYNRKKKEALIKNFNPVWKDIAFDWYKDVGPILPLILRKGIPHRLRRIRD